MYRQLIPLLVSCGGFKWLVSMLDHTSHDFDENKELIFSGVTLIRQVYDAVCTLAGLFFNEHVMLNAYMGACSFSGARPCSWESLNVLVQLHEENRMQERN